MADVEFKSNAKQITSEEAKAKLRALEKIGILVEGRAAKNAPVDTGRLRNSITHETEQDYAIIGTNVEYAPFQELGTSRMEAQPYLRPAVDQSQGDIKKILEQELGKKP